MSSTTNPFGAPLDDEEQISDVRRSPQQSRPRPLRTLTPNTRTAYAARASARRAALRDNTPEGLPPNPVPGQRPSFADVLAGVAASAAPQPQISADAPRSATTTAPSLGDLAAQQGDDAEPTPPTAPLMTTEAMEDQKDDRQASAAMLQLQMQGVPSPTPKLSSPSCYCTFSESSSRRSESCPTRNLTQAPLQCERRSLLTHFHPLQRAMTVRHGVLCTAWTCEHATIANCSSRSVL